MANQSIYNAFDRMWQHIVNIVGTKSSVQFITWEADD